MNSIKRLFIPCLYGLAFCLPLLVPDLFNKFLIAFVLVWLFTRPGVLNAVRTEIMLRPIIMIVLLMLIGLTYTSNIAQGIRDLEDGVILVMLPLVIFSSHALLDIATIRKVLLAFAGGVIVLNLSSLFFISFDAWDPASLQSKLIAANGVIARIHPAYTSVYISLCIFYIFDQHFPLPAQKRKSLGWIMFSLAVLFVYLFWLNSRAGILAFILAALFFIGYRWNKSHRLAGYFVLTLFIGLLIAIPYTRFRFIEAPKIALSADLYTPQTDPNIFPIVNRIQIYSCDIELIRWPSVLYGYGTGDDRDALQQSFRENNFERPLIENMDAHNEYFALLHRHGIMGLVFFLALILMPFRHAIKFKNPLLGAFIILFAVTAVFENVLSVQKGVTLFALFCPLLWLYAKRQAEENKQEVSGLN